MNHDSDMYFYLIILNKQTQCRKDVYVLLKYSQKIFNVYNSVILRKQLNMNRAVSHLVLIHC